MIIINFTKKIRVAVVCILILCLGVCFSYAAAMPAIEKSKSGVAVPIIMYHSILKEAKRAGTYVVSPDQFESDLTYLLNNGYTTILMQDLINYTQSGIPLPEKPVMITFDDGYYNNYFYIFPILQKYNAKAIISVIGKYSALNKPGEKLSANYSHITWEQMSIMQKSGLVEIQNHSYDMHTTDNGRKGSMKKRSETVIQYQDFFKNDVERLTKLLKDNCDITPTTFTYPFGYISKESKDVLYELGFSATLTSYEGINYINIGDSLYDLCRYNRPSGKTSEQFFKRIINKMESN